MARHLGAEEYTADAIARLNAAVVAALADPSVQQRFLELGQETPPPDRHDADGAEEPSNRGVEEVVADRKGGQHQGGVIVAQRF